MPKIMQLCPVPHSRGAHTELPLNCARARYKVSAFQLTCLCGAMKAKWIIIIIVHLFDALSCIHVHHVLHKSCESERENGSLRRSRHSLLRSACTYWNSLLLHQDGATNNSPQYHRQCHQNAAMFVFLPLLTLNRMRSIIVIHIDHDDHLIVPYFGLLCWFSWMSLLDEFFVFNIPSCFQLFTFKSAALCLAAASQLTTHMKAERFKVFPQSMKSFTWSEGASQGICVGRCLQQTEKLNLKEFKNNDCSFPQIRCPASESPP